MRLLPLSREQRKGDSSVINSEAARARHRNVPKFPASSNTTLLSARRVSTRRRGPGYDENLAERSPSEHVYALRVLSVEVALKRVCVETARRARPGHGG